MSMMLDLLTTPDRDTYESLSENKKSAAVFALANKAADLANKAADLREKLSPEQEANFLAAFDFIEDHRKLALWHHVTDVIYASDDENYAGLKYFHRLLAYKILAVFGVVKGEHGPVKIPGRICYFNKHGRLCDVVSIPGGYEFQPGDEDRLPEE